MAKAKPQIWIGRVLSGLAVLFYLRDARVKKAVS